MNPIKTLADKLTRQKDAYDAWLQGIIAPHTSASMYAWLAFYEQIGAT